MATNEISADSPWWHTQDDDGAWSGPFATRDDAIADAQGDYGDDEPFLICQAEQGCYSLGCFDGDDILERLADYNEEKVNEDGEIFHTANISPAMKRDLGDMVARAILEWTVKHSISITAWAFAAQGPSESIEPAVPAETVSP